MKLAQDYLQQEYHSIQKIGIGTFGLIFSVTSKLTNKQYACKIQKTSNRKTILVQKQFKMLSQLMSLSFEENNNISSQTDHKFPLVYSLKTLNINSFLIMEKFDKNIDNLFEQNNKKFNIKTIALITYQMLTSLEQLHKKGIVHRDIKPENIMTCIGKHQLKIIDFGLAGYIYQVKNKNSSSLIGNVRYASRGAHLGQSSPKDDLQALVYCISYLTNGSLPWQNSTTQEIELQISRHVTYQRSQQNIQMTPILQKKHNFLDLVNFPTTLNKIKQLFYQQLLKLFKFILQIQQKYNPNYKQINKIICRLMLIAGVNKGDCYEWCENQRENQNKCKQNKGIKKYWTVFEDQ